MSPQARRHAWTRRAKIMMQHTWLLSLAAILLCAALGGMMFYIATLPTHLSISVGPPNSEDVRVMHAVAAQLARDRASIRLHATVEDGGTRAAAAALDSGKADLAVVRHDTGMPRQGQAIAILRKNVVLFIVPSKPAAAKPVAAKPVAAKPATAAGAKPPAAAKKAPVAKIEGLIGRRLGVVGRSPNNIDLLKAILRQYNIAPDKVAILAADDIARPNAADKISVVQFDPYNVTSAIRDSNVDAIMTVGPVSSTITADAIAAATHGKNPPTFLAIGAAEAIAQRNPVYESTEIKAGAFGGSPPRPEESIETIGLNHYIVARKSLSEDTISNFTKLLFGSRQNIALEVPQATKIETPSTDKDAAVPVHPGAAAYIDGEVKTFFDRYSDMMYWGLMLVSLFGSGLVGLASYSKADDRVRRLGGLEKLVEITKTARTAATTQAIDELQAEIDAIQAGMIREVEDNTLDDAAMTAYSISIEQAQLAISDRRAHLMGHPRAALAAVAAG